MGRAHDPGHLDIAQDQYSMKARQVVCHIISDGFWYKMPTRKDGIPHDKGSNSPKWQNEYALDLET